MKTFAVNSLNCSSKVLWGECFWRHFVSLGSLANLCRFGHFMNKTHIWYALNDLTYPNQTYQDHTKFANVEFAFLCLWPPLNNNHLSTTTSLPNLANMTTQLCTNLWPMTTFGGSQGWLSQSGLIAYQIFAFAHDICLNSQNSHLINLHASLQCLY